MSESIVMAQPARKTKETIRCVDDMLVLVFLDDLMIMVMYKRVSLFSSPCRSCFRQVVPKVVSCTKVQRWYQL